MNIYHIKTRQDSQTVSLAQSRLMFQRPWLMPNTLFLVLTLEYGPVGVGAGVRYIMVCF